MPKKISEKTVSKIREDYVMGKESLSAICKKYKISFNTLRKYAEDYKWDDRGSVDKLIEASKLIFNEKIKAIGDDDKRKLINKVEKTVLQDIQKQLEVNITLKELQQLVYENQKIGILSTRAMLEKKRISKSVKITTTNKKGEFDGEKHIAETRELDGHELASLAKIDIERYKTFCQLEPETQGITINNHNQQANIDVDIEKLNQKIDEYMSIKVADK
jgi:hypothetical protein